MNNQLPYLTESKRKHRSYPGREEQDGPQGSDRGPGPTSATETVIDDV